MGKTGSLCGGHAHVSHSLVCIDCGTEKATSTRLTLFNENDLKLRAKLGELKKLLSPIQIEIIPLSQRLKQINSLLEQVKTVSNKIKYEVKENAVKYKILRNKEQFILKRIQEIQDHLKTDITKDGYFDAKRINKNNLFKIQCESLVSSHGIQGFVQQG